MTAVKKSPTIAGHATRVATRRQTPPPLTEADRAWAGQVGSRLRAEFAALVAALPAHERSAAGLERVLGTNRAIAHRLFSALATTDDVEVLTRIPGIEGLRKVTASARRKLGAAVTSVLVGTDSALNEFQELIRRTGGSHAKLIARLRAVGPSSFGPAEPASTPPGRRLSARRGLYDSVQSLCGRSIDVRTSISILRPSPDIPGDAEYAHTRAFIGYRAVPGGLPLVLGAWVTNVDESRKLDVDYRDLDNRPIEGLTNAGVLPEFCTSPLPMVASRDTTGRLVQIIDRTRVEPDAAIDAVTAYRLPSVGPVPSRLDPPIFLEAVTATSPTEHLVADFYLHRSLLVGGTPSLNLYLGRGSGGCDLLDRWHERIVGGPVLGLLGPGISNAHTSAWHRHAELTQHVFSRLGWNPLEFVGFRCEERWPLWYCDYVMTVDYRTAPDAVQHPGLQ